MCAFNQPKNTDDATINKVRGAILHRGLWMGLILMEARKRGLDWESIGHQAIFDTGHARKTLGLRPLSGVFPRTAPSDHPACPTR